MPNHYLNQCLIIVKWTLRNKLRWNFNQNTKLFIHENASENIVCEMVAILSTEIWVSRLSMPRVTYVNKKEFSIEIQPLSFRGYGYRCIISSLNAILSLWLSPWRFNQINFMAKLSRCFSIHCCFLGVLAIIIVHCDWSIHWLFILFIVICVPNSMNYNKYYLWPRKSVFTLIK